MTTTEEVSFLEFLFYVHRGKARRLLFDHPRPAESRKGNNGHIIEADTGPPPPLLLSH